MNRDRNQVFTGRSGIVLLLFPFWLILIYFNDRIGDWIIYTFFSMQAGAPLSQAMAFFIATFLKISLLLVFFLFLVSLLRSWFPVQKWRKRLMSVPPVISHFMAGFFGILTPFCSCSAVPLFIGFLEAGIPLGITFTFLLASPLVNEVILIMIAGLFGLKVTLIYLVTGLSVAIITGYIIGRLQYERYLPPWLLNFKPENHLKIPEKTFEARIDIAFNSVKEVTARIWIYVLAGIVIGSIINGYVPEEWLQSITKSNTWYTLPLVVLSGIPLYACSASVAPVAFALADKGIPLGTAMAFIMAVAGLSLPEFIMLRKVLSLRLILIFAGIVFLCILLTGYLFNVLM
jgi:uncharacterized membrane protein YraQ (UPF0718 family)